MIMYKVSNNYRNNSATISNNGNSYTAQLRRLKIQEGILSVNVNKTYIEYIETCNGKNKYDNSKDIKTYISKLKDSYIELKNLYEDIRVKTNIHETLEETDIHDLKRDVLTLEDKMKYLKLFLRNELNSLQSEETSLIEKSNENQTEARKSNVSSKMQTKRYNEIVPSPVRVMINAPLKCVEIHEFQEFMKNSANRYGGWNEYSHNLFVQIWNKYNGNEEFTTSIRDTRFFHNFKDEALQKIPGIHVEDVDSHFEWYSRYIYLKMCQQKALEKWKDNKKKIKKPLRESKKLHISIDGIPTNSALEIRREPKRRTHIKQNTEDSKILNNLHHESKLMQPTKQWIHRRENDKDFTVFESNIENIPKLRVPRWRMNI